MLVETGATLVIMVPKILSVPAVDKFYDDLNHGLSQKPSKVELDCSQIDLVTSSHVNLLWEARSSCLNMKIEVKLSFVSPGLVRVLKVLDLYDVFLSAGEAADVMENGVQEDNTAEYKERLNLEFRVEGKAITRALAEFRRFLSKLKIPMKNVIELEIVFYEVTTNIRLHSGLTSDNIIIFNATPSADKLAMRFTDRGKEFDPTTQTSDFDPEMIMKDRKKHGFGLTMITRMTSKMNYERKDGCINILTLEKVWR
ncbi:MAG: ATP-binding protein [Candidatus Zixiibacteriota bacterium]